MSAAALTGRLVKILLVGVLLLTPGLAGAEVRAWLDRDRIELGESATLNIETDGGGRPDYAPLEDDFRIEQQSSRHSYEQHGRAAVTRTLYAVALRPDRTGELTVPSLQVGGERTAPLTLIVTAASAAPARTRDPAFIEAEVDDVAPYVQQAVGLRLRLYYAPRLLSGQLEQPEPDGGALRRSGNDLQYTRDIGGRRYQVVERRYLLVPERSGRLEVPAARFHGRGVGGWLDDLFGEGQRSVAAEGPVLVLDVKPLPAAAPRPWLPLHNLQLRWLERPSTVRAGDAATIELELVADGATAAQLEPPALSADQGAQIFPEPPRHDETVEEGRPRVRMVRRFSVLPAREGRLRVEMPGVEWWDVDADRLRVATLPALEFDVAPAAPAAPESPGVAWRSGEETLVRVPGVQGGARAWALATVAFAFLWLATLAWALQLRSRGAASGRTIAGAGAGAPPDAAHRSGPGPTLRKALVAGELGDIAAALCALSSPPATDLDTLARMLAPGPQREAIAALQRARWGQGEGAAAAARTAVREAFARGPDWRVDDDGGDATLPPLYPR